MNQIIKVYGIIYLITNLINGKIYVGQTVQTLDRRWCVHKSFALNEEGWHLQAAIRRYGPENFSIVKIDQAYNQQELNFLETFHIISKGCLDNNIGYNVRLPGADSKWIREKIASQVPSSRVYKYPEGLEDEVLLGLYKSGMSLCQMSKDLNYSRVMISKRLRRMGIKIDSKPHKQNWPEKDICDKYNSGKLVWNLCKEYKTSQNVIHRILKENNLERRPARRIPVTNEQLLFEFNQGIDCDTIANKYDIDSSHVRKILKSFGLVSTWVPKLIDKIQDDLVLEYQSGLSTDQLAKKYKTTKGSVAVRLRKLGIEFRTKEENTKYLLVNSLPAQEIVSAYISGLSSTEIGKKYDTSHKTITKILENNNVVIHRNVSKRVIKIGEPTLISRSSPSPS